MDRYMIYVKDKVKLTDEVLQDMPCRFPEKEQEVRYICIPYETVAELQRVVEADLKVHASCRAFSLALQDQRGVLTNHASSRLHETPLSMAIYPQHWV